MLRLEVEEVTSILEERLLLKGFTEAKAAIIAKTFTETSLEGVYSHGINRFKRFIEDEDRKIIDPNASPEIISKFNGVQQWDGKKGPGILNALLAVDAAVHLSNHYGIGCVALKNTNHWMRGGTYGRKAAHSDCIFIGWTNTIANLPAWGAVDRRLGNNPLVMAVPGDDPVIIDMAMSQYSYGKMEDKVLKDENLPFPGGYNMDGELSNDPKKILESGRPLPVGYWKGAGLALVLDLLGAILSDGLSTADISKEKYETGLSQVFICIDTKKLTNKRSIGETIQHIINDYKESIPIDDKTKIVYPGERSIEIKKENLELGIPIAKKVWEDILNI